VLSRCYTTCCPFLFEKGGGGQRGERARAQPGRAEGQKGRRVENRGQRVECPEQEIIGKDKRTKGRGLG
jgi:hypothetical protein